MSRETLFTTYLNNLVSVDRQGDAREESFYPALASMLEEVAQATGRSRVHVTTLPRATEGGNPDFRLWNGTDRIIGYIEAKKPTEERLGPIQSSEQLTRYRSTFPNLILTNFLEFRLYRDDRLIQTASLGTCLGYSRIRVHSALPGKGLAVREIERLRQPLNNAHSLHTEIDDPPDRRNQVTRVCKPAVRIVEDSAALVSSDPVAINEPA